MAEITKETWQKIGLNLLDQEGLKALKISRISAELDVTKGSFYHWFSSKAHFEKSVLEYWKQVFTDDFIENADQGEDSKEKLKRLIQNAIHRSITCQNYSPECFPLLIEQICCKTQTKYELV